MKAETAQRDSSSSLHPSNPAAKLSLRQVAAQVGVSAATLSRIKNGVGMPD
jgi:DNA-binding MurR/RpiR family transcriptional regulator